MYFLYILHTPSNTLYIGVTEALDRRITTHNTGKGAKWTKVHKGGVLVYSEIHPTLGLARKREIQLKKWTRPKKEALIARDLAKLKNLSRCQSTCRSIKANPPE
jgi:putative endonuclease